MKKKASGKKRCDMCLHERPLVMKTKRRVWNRDKRRFNVVPRTERYCKSCKGLWEDSQIKPTLRVHSAGVSHVYSQEDIFLYGGGVVLSKGRSEREKFLDKKNTNIAEKRWSELAAGYEIKSGRVFPKTKGKAKKQR